MKYLCPGIIDGEAESTRMAVKERLAMPKEERIKLKKRLAAIWKKLPTAEPCVCWCKHWDR